MADGRFLSSTPYGAGSTLIWGKNSMADVKTKTCDGKYAAESTGTASAVVTKRQREVNDEYHKKGAEADLESGTAPSDTGPFKTLLNEYGQKGRVIGAFAATSSRHLRHCRPGRLGPRRGQLLPFNNKPTSTALLISQ